jgi:hypothetical protein
MSVMALTAKARVHWTKWLPEKVADLRADGLLEEALRGAAQLAQNQIDHLMQHRGYSLTKAEEVALSQFILLKPEAGAGQPDWEADELAEREREFRRNPPVVMGDEDE